MRDQRRNCKRRLKPGQVWVLRLSGTKTFFKIGQKNLFVKIKCDLLYLLIKDFPKFDPLTATGMALCVNLGAKCQNLFPLVSD
jgi:hypothetical protein